MNKVTTSPSKKFVSFLRSGIRKIVYRPTVVDFVFSAGAACRTATMLRRVNMRTFSSPLDWMFRYDLSLYSDLLHKREFDLFREYEENEESPSEHRNVRDLRTGMISLHHLQKPKHSGTIARFSRHHEQKAAASDLRDSTKQRRRDCHEPGHSR